MNNQTVPSLSLANPNPLGTNTKQKMALALVAIGFLFILIAWAAKLVWSPAISLFLSLSLITSGTIWYARETYRDAPDGIKNNGVMFRSISNRGIFGWMIGVLITAFYCCLYWFPEMLSGLVLMFDPLSQVLRGHAADQWFV